MLHIVYILAFTVIAFFAISNLIRSLISLSTESQRLYQPNNRTYSQSRDYNRHSSFYASIPHPELLDDQGKPIEEPLLVMRSVSVEDARQQLDQIYNSSPSKSRDLEE